MGGGDRADDGDQPRHARDRDDGHLDSRPAPGADQFMLTDPELRAAESRRYRAIADKSRTPDRDPWSAAVPDFRAAWEIIKEKYEYPDAAESEPTSRTDGSWRGEGGRTLDAEQNDEIDRGYERICAVGENVIVPRVVAIEGAEPDRILAGFERHLKGADRVKEKVADLLEPPSTLTAADALSAIVDVVRFTFKYQEVRYAQGVLADVERLTQDGLVLDRLKNTWTSDQYKGVNSQWVEPASGVRFEVQFHTHASLEAKELTHKAYERLRTITGHGADDEREATELAAFQGKANAAVPIPPGVGVIEDYRREQRHG